MNPYEPVGWGMRPSPARRFLPVLMVLVVVVVIAFVGFGGGNEPEPTPASLPPSPVVGLVEAVDSEGLGQVRAFAISLPDGTAFDLTMGPLENATEFPPAHLAEHVVTRAPIRAYYRLENGVPVVYRLEDASG